KDSEKAGAASASPSAGIEDGAVSGNIYKNAALGMTYQFPQNWRAANPDSLRTLNGRAEAAAKAAILQQHPEFANSPNLILPKTVFYASRKGDWDGQHINLPSVRIGAIPSRLDSINLDSFQQMVSNMATASGLKIIGTASEFHVNKHSFARADFERSVGATRIYQSFVQTMAGDYLLTIAIYAYSADELQQAASSLQSMSVADEDPSTWTEGVFLRCLHCFAREVVSREASEASGLWSPGASSHVYSVVLSRSDLMKRVILLVARVAVCGVLFFCAAFSGTVSARAAEQAFVSRSAEIDGVKLRYTTGGHGPSVILLHGYAETSRMWTPILPVLGEKFTVIAPDLPGIGESSIPADGLDLKTAAIRIHALARSLGVEKARVVGHDIGLMVAYAYDAQFPGEVEKLVVMDAFLPGVGEWGTVYNN